MSEWKMAEAIRPESLLSVRELVDYLVDSGRVSAAVALTGNAETVDRVWCGGSVVGGSATRCPDEDSRFDLASLSKPWAATLAIALDQQGVLSLRSNLVDIWPDLPSMNWNPSLADLLRHQGGLQSWAPLYALCRDVATVERLLLTNSSWRSAKSVYSDLGYILWGLAVEKVLGRSLEEVLSDVLSSWIDETCGASCGDEGSVECQLDSRREVELAASLGEHIPLLAPPRRGEPQDGNARFLGGFPGHAGLFGSARSLWSLGRIWLGHGGLIRAENLENALSGGASYGLGWARQSGSPGAGAALHQECFGHLGFTGCSMWVDPTARKIFILAAHRTQVDVDLMPWRRRFHALCAV